MCILFFHAKKVASPGKFRLILVSNRDEQLKRPTQQAHFWTDFPDIFGGRDLQGGSAVGTWLAVNSKTGRLATLLNLPCLPTNPNALSRGHIVAEFVKDVSISSANFAAKVSSRANQFNPFHFLAIDILPSELLINYWAHTGSEAPLSLIDLSPTDESNSTHSISNSHLLTPLNKCKKGLDLFQEIVADLDDTNRKDELCKQLVSFAKTDTKFWPDEILSLRTDLEPHLEKFSSIFVDVPENTYGTRTHTVILVDDVGKMDYFESTLTENEEGGLEWRDTRQTFDFNQIA
ncbi:Hypothetical predicted protein [Cloeon dipterum]|uniref:Transport and Golgi organization protein 2 n=1 Tax=Cloeon dipterum TaxID=197152 RepID=A0A8S1CNG0_9INSE|nr:Hypothetical predicted protein [Cloeon dipterum]